MGNSSAKLNRTFSFAKGNHNIKALSYGIYDIQSHVGKIIICFTSVLLCFNISALGSPEITYRIVVQEYDTTSVYTADNLLLEYVTDSDGNMYTKTTNISNAANKIRKE